MGSRFYEPVAEKGLVSIGALAEATGLSPATLRVWERRYGKPVPVRLPSGHRRYRERDIPWLRGVAEALAHGHKPSSLLDLDLGQLEALLAGSAEQDGAGSEDFLAAVRAFDRDGLEAILAAGWREAEPLVFLQERLGPLLEFLGRLWASGEIDVRHEHFASEVVGAFLHARRSELPRTGLRAGRVLLTTLSGERHGLGLLALSLVCALGGVEWHLLGVDTPNAEIAAAVQELQVDLVVVSISLATGGPETDRRLRELAELLPEGVELAAGGAGARRGRRGVVGVRYFPDFRSFRMFLDSRF